jgi:phosphohistidine phosphatase SixA
LSRTNYLTALLLGFALLLGLASPALGGTVWLVRHTEKADDGTRDPALTAAGKAQAELLAVLLRDAGIEQIYSTDYLRTRDTVVPLASRIGVEITLYDPASPQVLVELLQDAAGSCLVVGHSNTIPELVKLLGGDPHGAIGHDEHDRLYQVVLLPDGSVRSTLLRLPGVR